MKKLIINKEDAMFSIDVIATDENDYNIILNITDEIDLKRKLTDQKKFKNELSKSIKENIKFEYLSEEISKKIENELLSNFKNILNVFDYIDLTSSEFDFPLLLKIYPDLSKCKLIVLSDIETFDEKFKETIDYFNKISSNCYFLINGNHEPIKSKELKKTIEIINGYADYIKSLNLSPLEQVMFAYDIVRERTYNEEKENESYFSSRDLTDVLLGTNIVCVGYSNLLKTILLQLGIRCRNVVCIRKDDEHKGHLRNMIYLNDEKYNVEGVYFLDATWDSKKSGEDKLYPYRYKYFLKTFEEMLDEDKNLYFYDRLSIDVNKLSQMKASELDYSDEDDKEIIDTIGTLSNLVYTETTRLLLYLKINPSYRNSIPISENEVEEITQYLFSLFNKKISAETFISLYMSVKSLEYYINPTKTTLDINYLYRTFLYSKWIFNEFIKKSKQKLLCDIFGKEVEQQDIFKEYIIHEKIEQDISRVKLTKTLKNVINTKTMT